MFYFFSASGPVVLVKYARDLLNLYYNSYSIENDPNLLNKILKMSLYVHQTDCCVRQ